MGTADQGVSNKVSRRRQRPREQAVRRAGLTPVGRQGRSGMFS
jgi:hypothetical protein